MKVKVPKVIKIGGIRVRIFYEDKLLDNHSKYGQCRFPEGEIVIQERDMSNDTKSQTLCHEITHWLDKVYNNYQFDENTTDAIGQGLYALLVDMGIEFDWSNISEVDK